ncbi:50S ribosomal protein L29 [Candidatus Peregrinibacteria bacterium]|nr:50S ribosomal protein L29 [Candidatus Peregrinibacteria bacterium]
MAASLTMTEIRSMGTQDLNREIKHKRATIGALRLAVSLGKEKNTMLYRKAKRELAQLLTVAHAQS